MLTNVVIQALELIQTTAGFIVCQYVHDRNSFVYDQNRDMKEFNDFEKWKQLRKPISIATI